MRPTENGVYTEVPREEYDRIERTNWSTLKHLKKSPAHFRATMLERVQEDTDALKLGRATHVATLEPERFLATHAIWDGGRRYGKEWDKFVEKNGHLEIITEDQYRQAKAIAEAARNDRNAAPHLRDGAAEVTMLWTHVRPTNGIPGYEIQCKGRIDFAAKGGAVVDLKTTRDASPEAFARQCWNMDYAAQAAFYVDGYAAAHGGEALPYIIVAVEKDAPFVTQVYTVPEHVLDIGRDTYRRLLDKLAECRRESRWPGYSDGPLELKLPSWMQDDSTTGMGLVFEGESLDATGL